MKQITAFLFCYICCLSAFGQYETVWGKHLSSTSHVKVNQTAVDNSGNSYSIGLFKGTIDLDPGTGVQSVTGATADGDLFIQKLDPSGNLVWAKTLPVNVFYSNFSIGIAVDNSGNVYTTGDFSGTVDFNPGPGVNNLTRQSAAKDAYILKLNSAGNFVWVRRIAAPTPALYGANAAKIHLDNLGNILMIGSFGSTVDFDPGPGVFNLTTAASLSGYIAKYDNNGNFITVKEIYNAGALQNVSDDANGNIILSGFMLSTIDCDPSAATYNLTPVGSSDGFIIKLTPAMDFIWARQISGSGADLVRHHFIESTGDILFTGEFTGTVDFDPGPGIFNMTTSGSTEMFVCKYNASGNLLWARQTHSATYALGLAVLSDDDGFVYTTGGYRGLTSFSMEPADTLNNFTLGKSCLYLSKHDVNGNFVSATRIGGTAASMGYRLQLDPVTDNLLLAGEFDNGNVDVDVQAGVTNFATPGNVTNVFFVKLQPACVSSASSLNISHCSIYTVPSGDETYTVSGTYTDTIPNAAGCDSIITINLTISDLVAPVANAASLANVTSQCSVASLTAPTATDNCAGTITGTTSTTLPILMQGTTVVTWTYNDGNGNTATQTQNVVITDNIAPVADLPSLANVTSQCSVASLTAPTATDNCVGSVTGTTSTTLPITAQGTTVVTWTYNDGHGNTSTQTQNVVITDNIAPVANAASLTNVTSQCSVASLTAPTATDNCAGTITGTTSTTLPITTQGTTVVTWTYNDGHGNTSTQTQNVVITDNIAPVANVASLADITSQCSVASLAAPTATDNCAGTITGTTSTTLPITTQGTTVVTWTYNDGHGNTSTQTQNVVMTDNLAPVANLASLANVTSQCSVASLTAPTATDNCAGMITGTTSTTLPITTQGTTVVTWTYNDGHGNTSTQTQNVVITDNIAPVANLASLANVTSQCSVASLTAPTATDNCAGTITGTTSTTLPITTQGTTVVTWTYNDGHGNTSTQTQNVVITDNIAPVADLANLPAITGNCSVAAITAPTATDNCAGTITGTTTTIFPITTAGNTTVTWTFNDGHGNTSMQTQNVTVTVPVATTTLSGLTITATTSGAVYQWINCGTGNTPISGATSQSFTATANGTYAVIVTQNGCSSTSSCVTIATVGLDDKVKEALFEVYPNPNRGIFTIRNSSALQVTITNAAGQLISVHDINPGENIVELGNVESGVYLVIAKDENNEIIVRRLSVVQ